MMDRRQFVGTTVAGGAGLALGGGCTAEAAEQPLLRASSQVRPFELDEVDVAELQRSLASGERTARSITELYLGRIEALNLQGPELRAIIEINPDALAIADELDAERAAGNVRGPLHGIPVAVKDNIDTHDRMTTTAGSLALEGSIPEQDSFVAQKLREAGAIILAKANLSEWANFRGRPSTSGWSARGGQCRNPYALDRNPCGSSAGSGVAASSEPRSAHDRDRNQWVDHLSVVDKRSRRDQADGGTLESVRDHPDLSFPRHCGPDVPDRARRGHTARCLDRYRLTRCGDVGESGQLLYRLHTVPQRLGASRSTHWIGA